MEPGGGGIEPGGGIGGIELGGIDPCGMGGIDRGGGAMDPGGGMEVGTAPAAI